METQIESSGQETAQGKDLQWIQDRADLSLTETKTPDNNG
jgi:hypothetical protein